ncbi:hypothetical protein B0T22DRAFT_469556 [Podospora appendiculata]|uniref:AA1-like domain-containing protein n=1 Tax=Podospora appendiculata TaxID=314037 RepID=A0AAE0X3K6_9PEZI|nr:hypothetical protein B0T22DRAFT_469556 [Podospora appendiculata]
MLGLATLSALLLSVSTALATPVTVDTKGVDHRYHDLLKLEWKVKGFDFHSSYIFTTPAHQNSWGYVNFNVTSIARPEYTAVCSATSNVLSDFFFGTMVFQCQVPATAPANSTLGFKYSRPTGELDIIETGSFKPEGPHGKTDCKRPLFTATGTKNLTLSCTDTTTVNQNWTMGQIYSDREVKCAKVDAKVRPTQIVPLA